MVVVLNRSCTIENEKQNSMFSLDVQITLKVREFTTSFAVNQFLVELTYISKTFCHFVVRVVRSTHSLSDISGNAQVGIKLHTELLFLKEFI